MLRSTASAESKTYHHEDLHAALLQAGRAFIAEHGHDRLSVRALAQATGVSPGAPYHHFRDRRSLLVALAMEGFDRLNGEGDRIVRQNTTGAEKLIALGNALIDFCAAEPRLFTLMYDSELTLPTIEPTLGDAQKAGFELVTRAFRKAAPFLEPHQLQARAMAFWATLYGYAALTGKGLLQAYVLADTPEELARLVIVRQAVGDLAGTG